MDFNNKYKLSETFRKYLLKKYHPKFFYSMADFTKTDYFKNKNITINEYTDDYISENENYLIILFDNYKDFSNVIESDNYYGDAIIVFDNCGKITKKYYSSCDQKQIKYIESFIDKEI